jgi:hypothetical protein
MNYTDFKKKYEEVIYDHFELTEKQIKEKYEIYLEDPQQFRENMLNPDE